MTATRKRSRSRSRRAIGLALRLVLAIGIMLVVGESLARWWDPLGVRYYSDAQAYVERLRPDARFAYSHVPGDRFEAGGVAIDINSLGLRDDEPESPREPGRRRLVILGDSVVFGWAVRHEETFPPRVESILRERGCSVEVLSAGAGSWNSRTEREWMLAEGFALEPDAIVLVAVWNDVEPKTSGLTSVPIEVLQATIPPFERTLFGLVAARSRLAASIRHPFARAGARGRLDAYLAEDSPAWEDARAALRDLARDARERGVPLIAFVFGDPSDPSNAMFLERYRRVLEGEGVAVHEFPPEVFEMRHRISPVDRHPNAAGHELMAAEIARAFVSCP